MGCEKGLCNYRTGNYQADRWTRVYKQVLEFVGLNPDRLHLNLESDTEIIHTYDRFYKQIQEMGPIGSELGIDKEKVKEVFEIVDLTLLDEEIKWLVGREWTLVTIENSYGEVYDEETFRKILDERLKQQFLIARITYLTKDKPMTTVELASAIGVSPQEVFNALVEMQRKERATLVGFENRLPVYQSIVK